jgi:hypothetical protein
MPWRPISWEGKARVFEFNDDPRTTQDDLLQVLAGVNRLSRLKAPRSGCAVWRAGKAAPVAVHQGRLDVAAH